MKLVLIALLALSVPLIAAPTAVAHNHCEDLPYDKEIVCRVLAAAAELIPFTPTTPVGPILP